jgi:hypothetical protein
MQIKLPKLIIDGNYLSTKQFKINSKNI